MTGRKVTRRASMRRKSMRSPSVTRSAGSKTPRSVVSEPNASGNASFNSSNDKLDSELAGSLASLPATNSSERLSKANQKSLSAVVADNDVAAVMSSSEQLASELAAVKIADSKENLTEVAVKNESKASLNEIAAKNESKGSLNDLSKNNNSKGSIRDLAKNRSTASLNKSDASLSNLNTEIVSEEKATESVKEEAKKSTDELVAVSLNETQESEQVSEEKTAEPAATTESAAPTSEPAASSTEAPAAVQPEEDQAKKSCLAQKAAKCRCIIS